MRDEFTKGELEAILDCINYACATRPAIAAITDSVLDKIQSMIDNYDKDKKTKDNLNYILQKAREWKIDL